MKDQTKGKKRQLGVAAIIAAAALICISIPNLRPADDTLSSHHHKTTYRELQFVFDSNGDLALDHHDKSFTCEVRLANDTIKRAYIDKNEISKACSMPTLEADDATGKMGAIVQTYNHQSTASDVISSLASQVPVLQDVLVYDDGSTDGSQQAYQDSLSQHSVLRGSLSSSPDIHEIRNYNLGMKRLHEESPQVQYYALMQDDDVLRPGGDPWALRAIQLFEDFPRLCVLGGYCGWQAVHGGFLNRTEYYTEEKSYNGKQHVRVRQTCHGSPFAFMAAIASAPMIIRKSCYEDIGPLSEMYTKPGDPGIMFDVEYSARAWANGWQVGLFYANYTHGVGGHGTTINKEKRDKRMKAAIKGIQYVKHQYRSLACHYTNLNSDQVNVN